MLGVRRSAQLNACSGVPSIPTWIIWGCFLQHRPWAGWDPSNQLRAEISFNLPLTLLKMVTGEADTHIPIWVTLQAVTITSNALTRH